MAILGQVARFLLRKEISFNGKSVLTLGRQDVHATQIELDSFLKHKKIINDKTGKLLTDKEFFKKLGYEEVYSIDKFDPGNNDFNFDLNNRIDLQKQFDLVADFGTVEHIFNIAEAIKTMAKHTKLGGMILNISPTSGYFNHGFFCLNPTFFHSFYLKNGFELVGTFILQFRDIDYSMNFKSMARLFRLKENLNNIPFSTSFNSLIVVAAVKRLCISEYISPDQFYYENQFVKNESVCKNSRQNLSRRALKFFLPGFAKQFLLKLLMMAKEYQVRNQAIEDLGWV